VTLVIGPVAGRTGLGLKSVGEATLADLTRLLFTAPKR